MSQQTRTVLFTDIVGSTRLRTSRGDDVGDTQLRLHDEVVHRTIEENDGIVVKGLGDGCLATFVSARAAVAAAVEIQRQLLQRRSSGTTVELRLRIGINAGDVREVDGDFRGEAVNAAARIVAQAQGDEILVSRVVRELVGTAEVAFEDRGEIVLRGFPTPWNLYAVQWADGSDAGTLRVQLLGGASVVLDGTPVAGFDSPRLQRLLARLVLDPGVAHSRMQLAFELWPDSTEVQARTNLRKLVHDLRHALPAIDRYADLESQTLRWRGDAPATVDVVAFCDAIERDELAEALEVYGGDLLPACYDDWVLAERDRLRRAATDALARLARDAAERGDDLTALTYGHQLVRMDVLSEEGYRVVMAAHARRGERVDAIRAYHRCAEVLARELGVEPDPVTTALYDEVRDGGRVGPAPPVSPATEVRAPVVTRSPLVGRDGEWERVVAAWRAAAAGRAGLLLVSGEPGIGKSRLVEELARFVASEGRRVARARAYQSAGRLPWGPVVDWLRTDDVRSRIDGLDAVHRAELARILPELRTGPTAPSPGAPDADDARHALFGAIAAVLARPGDATLLVLDDVQWCDADSLELVGYLVRHAPDAPVLVAATVRQEEIDDADELSGIVADLAREGALTELALEPLDAAATADLATRLSGKELDAAAAEQLWRETEGNPLFVVEALRAGPPASGRAAALTPTVQAVISGRLAQLSREARALAEVAATVGRAFRVDVLAAATGSTEDDLVEPLDELWRRRIIREQAAGYDFTHDRLREVAHDGISPARRRRLHRAVADALVEIHGDARGSISAPLAAHYEAAGLVREAVDAHRAAAEHALAVFALDDAIASLRRAISLLGGLPADRERDELELELRVAVASPLVARDGYATAGVEETYERALALCRRLDRRIDPAVLRGLGLAALSVCRFDSSRKYAQALLDHRDDPVALVEGHYLMGVSQFWRAHFADSCDHLQAAIDLYRPELGPEHWARYAQDPKGVCLVRLAFAVLWRGDVARARALAQEAREFVSSIDHPYTTVYVYGWLAMIDAETADLDALADDLRTTDEMATQTSLGYAGTVIELMSGWLDVAQGRAGGLERIAAVVEDFRGVANVQLTHGLALLAQAHQRSGDLDGARAAVREAIEWGLGHDQRWAESELWRIDATVLAAAGDDDGARAAYERGLALATEQQAGLLVERITEEAGHPLPIS